MSDSSVSESAPSLVPVLEDILNALEVRKLKPRRIAISPDGGLEITLASVAFVEPEAPALTPEQEAELEAQAAAAEEKLMYSHSQGY